MIKGRPSSIVRDSETVKLERKVGYLCYLESKIDMGWWWVLCRHKAKVSKMMTTFLTYITR